jgi:methyltransferase family protein
MRRLTYTPFESVPVRRPVFRIPYLVEAVTGKAVLDLGAYDETALTKTDTEYWLHGQLSRTARLVVGLDKSDALPQGGIVTAPNSRILKLDFADLPTVTRQFDFDVVVGGELIEHLSDPLAFLGGLRADPALSDRTLIITTPNATALHNAGLALVRRESQHQDHLQIYSYKTLNTLFVRAGFTDFEIFPYHVLYSELCLRMGGLRRGLIRVAEVAVHGMETLFPLLSGGWIVEARIR